MFHGTSFSIFVLKNVRNASVSSFKGESTDHQLLKKYEEACLFAYYINCKSMVLAFPQTVLIWSKFTKIILTKQFENINIKVLLYRHYNTFRFAHIGETKHCDWKWRSRRTLRNLKVAFIFGTTQFLSDLNNKASDQFVMSLQKVFWVFWEAIFRLFCRFSWALSLFWLQSLCCFVAHTSCFWSKQSICLGNA